MDVQVSKIRRCSDKGSVLADLISKGSIRAARKLWREMGRMRRVPRVLIKWIKEPMVDCDLGKKILIKLKKEL